MKERRTGKKFYYSEYHSPVGRLTLAADGDHLVGLWIEGQKYFGGTILSSVMPGSVISDAASKSGIRGNAVSGGAMQWKAISENRTQMNAALECAANENAASGNGVLKKKGSCSAERDDGLEVFGQTKRWLDRYFAGERPTPGELPLAPVGGEFRQRIWRLLCEIPYGGTTTYGALAGQVAAELGRPTMSAQAVGGAVGHNPISIIIPCHRVLGSDGSLTGYAGGLNVKRYLLQLESGGRNYGAY